MKPARNLTLVQPELEPAELVERRRAKAKARTIAGIGAHRPADDVRHYAGGHEWRRHRDHETMVLRVLQGRSFDHA